MTTPSIPLIFDLDGTLVDSRRDLADSVNLMLDTFGIQPFSEPSVGQMVGDGAATLVARAFTARGRAQPADALARFLEIYSRRLLAFTRPYPEIARVLAEFSQERYLAVLTNKPLGATRRILDGLGLTKYFASDAVLGGDGPHARKPDPAGLRWLLQASGTAPGAAILVGDSPVDQRTARAAGIRWCAARYGFGFDPAATLDRGDLAADTPRELLTVL